MTAPSVASRQLPHAGRRGAVCRCLWCRKGQGWNIHHGFLLHLIGMKDADIAEALGISPAAVTKRRRLRWEFGRA